MNVKEAILFLLFLCVFFLYALNIAQAAPQVEKWSVYEITSETTNVYSNPYLEVSLSAVFTGPTKTITIEGFWDGGNTWKIRMAPTELGTWNYVTISSDPQLDGETGSFEVIDSGNKGFIKVNPEYPHTFMYADGTPFFFMGDTQWLRVFYSDINKFKQMVDNRAAQRFNVFTMSSLAVFGSQTVANEGGYLYLNGDLSQINPDFFKYADLRIQYLDTKGIKPMIVIGSPDHKLGNHPQEKIEALFRYIIARWAAYDVIWEFVKEYEEWPISRTKSLGGIVEQYDPYKHLTSVHTIDTTSDDFGGTAWLDFNSRHSRSLNGVLSDYNSVNKPVVVAEAYYEGPTYSDSRDFDNPEVLLEGLWGIQLCGGWNAGYQLVPDATNMDMDKYLSLMNNTAAEYHTHLYTFFQNTEYWKMTPNDNLVTSGTAYCLANPGNEYVIYLPKGGSVTADLSDARGTLNVDWYNPGDGTYYDERAVTGGGSEIFTPPFSGDAVLHILSIAFDTGEGTYPSISGTHTGTIKPSDDITVQKLYTYPCPGTGGHSEYVRLWNAFGTIAEGNWTGYEGDWYTISFDKQFILKANKTYNYSIRTGSYPQIMHKPTANVTGGTITCEEFMAANGKSHNDWIPAIKLYSAGAESASSSILDDMVHGGSGGDTEPPSNVLYNTYNSALNRLLNVLGCTKGFYNRLFCVSKLI